VCCTEQDDGVILYRFVGLVTRPVIALLFRPRVHGVEHLPRHGGFVLSANHLSGFDVWAVTYALYPRQPRNMAKNELFVRPLLGPIVRSLGAFPAHGDGTGGGASGAAALAVAGNAVVIYPEGARRRPGREHRPRTGAARAALEAGVPLVPAAIRGTDGWRRLARWQVAVGEPIPLGDLSAEDAQRSAREATSRLWAAIEELGTGLDRGG
jgi:1-acyl-sn-glycerol-3-phosphate acyltransferase